MCTLGVVSQSYFTPETVLDKLEPFSPSQQYHKDSGSSLLRSVDLEYISSLTSILKLSLYAPCCQLPPSVHREMLCQWGFSPRRWGQQAQVGHPILGHHSSSSTFSSQEIEDIEVLSPTNSIGLLVAHASMKLIVEQLQHIKIDIDILRDQRYKNCNEIFTYLTNIQYSQNTILEQLDNLLHSQCHTNDHPCSLKAWVEHINFHIHNSLGYFAAPLVMLPIPLLEMLSLILVSSYVCHILLRPYSHLKIMYVNCVCWYSLDPNLIRFSWNEGAKDVERILFQSYRYCNLWLLLIVKLVNQISFLDNTQAWLIKLSIWYCTVMF